MVQQPSLNDTKLSSKDTIAQYREFERDQNREAIAAMIRQRFTERYITPLRGETKHGFSLMAVSCLMIEALQSFYEGWPNTKEPKRGKEAFKKFLEGNPEFILFVPYAGDFYSCVRCGILHQAETTGGWRILRIGALFDPQTRTINATLFHDALEKVLNRYCTSLETEPWDSELWKKCRKKLDSICNNCVFTS